MNVERRFVSLELYRSRCQELLEDAAREFWLSGAFVEGRVKSAEAIALKRERRQDEWINDLIGLRLIACHGGQLANAVAAVIAWGDTLRLDLRSKTDYFERPGAGGYRAVHFDFEIRDPAAAGLHIDAGIEVQVTTALLAAVARASHELLYARRSPRVAGVSRRLEKLAQDALGLDTSLAELSTFGACGA